MESSDEEDFLAFNADIIDNDAPAAVLENDSENGDSVVQQSGTQVYESPYFYFNTRVLMMWLEVRDAAWKYIYMYLLITLMY